MHTANNSMLPVAILGTGHALPKRRVSSQALDKQLHLTAGTVAKVSGVIQRYFAACDETAANLGAQAAQRALTAAQLSLSDIDCLVCVSGTMDQGLPYNAALLHRELGLSDAAVPAFDINASCLSFLAALDTLSFPLSAGRYRHILLVAADLASCGLNWQRLKASAIFGDGAAAVIIGKAHAGQGLLASDLMTLSEGADFCRIPAGGSRFHPSRIDRPFAPLTQFHMDGKRVFKLAAQYLPAFVERLLQRAKLCKADIDRVVPHQASHLALSHIGKRLGFASEKVVNIFAGYGNQVAASLPTALDIAIRDGRIIRGNRILLLGTGAGLSLGGAVMVY